MDITPGDLWGWAVPPENLWQPGEALPALQTHTQRVQLKPSAELPAALLSLCSLALGFFQDSGIWDLLL